MKDSEIVQLYWERKPEAISVTSDKYGGYCKSIAKSILGSAEDAEECVNDTYMNAWNSMPPHKPAMLSTFLGKIARNLAFNRYKSNHADKRGSGELPAVLDELEECVSGKSDVEQELDNKELANAISGFLRSLSSQQRKVFVCRYWYSDRISDIADRCGMKVGAVTMTLSRLRLKLRSYLLEKGFDL